MAGALVTSGFTEGYSQFAEEAEAKWEGVLAVCKVGCKSRSRTALGRNWKVTTKLSVELAINSNDKDLVTR